jgi:hypothetical protein
MGVDSAGGLWVLNAAGPLVRYKSGAVDPQFATYRGLCAGGIGYSGPAVLAVDRFGTAYVGVNCGSSPSGPYHALVQEYDSSRFVARTIMMPANEQPVSIQTDSSGRLYLGFFDSSDNGRAGIAEYARGATKPLLTFQVSPPVYYAFGFLAFDSDNNLYFSVGECESSGSGPTCTSFISEYKNGTSKQIRTFNAPPKTLFGDLALDRSYNIYVNTFPNHDTSGNRIRLYAPTDNKGKVFISGYRLGNPLIYP